jgi:protein disulfide-isomerase
MGALGKEAYSGTELKELYAKSCELDQDNDSIRLITAGMNSSESLYFQLERYRLFADEGMIHTREAKALRQQLLAADPNNARQIPYQLAVIDFEASCTMMDKENITTEQVVAPLVAYVDRFSGKDKENIWRLEMIVSQVYLDNNDMVNALIHAQASYEAAPNTAKNEIAKAVNSIRSQIQPSLAKKIIGKK